MSESERDVVLVDVDCEYGDLELGFGNRKNEEDEGFKYRLQLVVENVQGKVNILDLDEYELLDACKKTNDKTIPKYISA
ncbi:hypothetical protein QVD17_38215 [Tagetes erecta]|uniref:Uncharacterized protein n=1 Tax=Tagetes erecta TaxID=13708 RepID=A0AAD8JXB7_TARER|nr:hypothetical protein QVD17_38215 [Tagetes erecta]